MTISFINPKLLSCSAGLSSSVNEYNGYTERGGQEGRVKRANTQTPSVLSYISVTVGTAISLLLGIGDPNSIDPSQGRHTAGSDLGPAHC